MDGVLNDSTRVVHERNGDTDEFTAACGALRRVDAGQLEPIETDTADEDGLEWCGRCFERGGGY